MQKGRFTVTTVIWADGGPDSPVGRPPLNHCMTACGSPYMPPPPTLPSSRCLAFFQSQSKFPPDLAARRNKLFKSFNEEVQWSGAAVHTFRAVGGWGAHLIGAQAGVCVCSGRGGDVRLTLVAFQHRHHQDEYTAHLHPHSAVSQSKSSLQLYNRNWLYPPPPQHSPPSEKQMDQKKKYIRCAQKKSAKKNKHPYLLRLIEYLTPKYQILKAIIAKRWRTQIMNLLVRRLLEKCFLSNFILFKQILSLTN